MDKANKKWFPLESNPEVMARYCNRLGFSTEHSSFVDVLSTDDWALDMISQPILALLMVFPVKPASEAHRASERETLAGQVRGHLLK